MCLYLNGHTNKVLIAPGDITVYKHLIALPNSDGSPRFVTPYQYADVEVPSEVTTFMSYVHNMEVDIAIHAFMTERDAHDDAMEEFTLSSHNYVVVKCIIPKGTKYYIGSFANRKACATEKLVYKEIVETISY